jgi:hypothetical protein
MKILFKPAPGSPADLEVQHTDFKTQYPEVNHSMAWDEITPYIEQATETYIIPYIGTALYNELATAYETDGGSSLSAEKKEALRMLRRAVAYYTIMHALPKKLGVIASMGNVVNDPNGGAQPPTQWMYKNQLLSITKDADTYLDMAIEYIYANQAEFSGWSDSAAAKNAKTDLFASAREFEEYHRIGGGSFRTFLALKSYIQKSQQRYILPVLGNELLSALTTAVKSNSASEAQKSLLERTRQALADYAVYMAIPHLACIIEEDGLKTISLSDGMSTANNAASAFYKEAIDLHRQSSYDYAETAKADLIEFLHKNVADYPQWETSDFYTAAQDTAISTPILGDSGPGSGSVFL